MPQVNEHALTINVLSSDESRFEIVVGTPTIELRDGDVLLTITVTMTRESTNSHRRSRIAEGRSNGSLKCDSAMSTDTELLPMPSMFRLWYLCEHDGSEWSTIDDDPSSKSQCPECQMLNSPIAIFGMPEEPMPSSDKTVSKFVVCRNLGCFHQN